MPPTLVHVSVGVLVGCALLGAAFDRRSIAVVAVAAGLPDADALVSLVVQGATNAVFHSLFLPALAGGVLYYDTTYRSESWLQTRCGRHGVRVAWVALAGYLVAGIGLDLCNVESAAVLYPLSDRFYSVIGKFVLSTQEGVVQTYVSVGGDRLLEVRSPGTTATYHVASWVNPTPGTATPAGVERRVRLVDAGWQLVVVATAVAMLVVRLAGFAGQSRPPAERTSQARGDR